MNELVFDKAFTQQEPICEAAIDRVVEILRGGRLHRYNTAGDEIAEVTLLEQEYAAFQGAPYCLALTSGGQAMQIALRAAGLKPGDKVLANAYTLAPVPGAIHVAGGVPVFVETGEDWRINLSDLHDKAKESGARFMLLSHMRGHIADMAEIVNICQTYDITLIEDCAHTMGARFNGIRSGNFGDVACFSTQTYKHLNSGEGGFITTSHEEIAARAVIMSGSYMLYDRHGAVPDDAVFQRVRLTAPNCSARLDNVRAAILRAQLPYLEENIKRWNERYRALESGLRDAVGVKIIERHSCEDFVGSSFQFHTVGIDNIPAFMTACARRGVELKWFGADEPVAFTSRYDSWRYFDDLPDLPQTRAVLATTLDLRVPLTFSVQDCEKIALIIADEAEKARNHQG